MKKINLKEFDVFTDISKRQRVRCDMRRSVANLLYNLSLIHISEPTRH